ncbi:MAG: type II secretion system F family protein [bacterium]|nr:type II secretion system F family protein [bacterium]
MSLYHYKGRDSSGAEIEGDRDAKDQYELAKTLRAEGFLPTYIVDAKNKKEGLFGRKFKLDDYIPSFLRRIKLDEKMNFARNTAVMVGAGLALTKAMEVMTRQTENEKFKGIIFSMVATIKSGKTFAEALGEFPAVFPNYFVEMVRAGEKSGKLEGSLKLVAMQLKKDYTLRRKVRSAMIYPAVIVVAMIGIGILMLIYVVPTLISTFEELKVELPLSTRIVIFLSQSLLQSGIFVAIGAGIMGYFVFRFLKSTTGKNFLDWGFTHAPVLKGINQKLNSARTCRTLSSLLSSGVDVLEALLITKGVLQNHYFQKVLVEARERIQKGENISKAFLAAEYFPPLVGEMMAVGEETGELSQMLLRLAMFYETEVSAATKDLSTIIEPLLMIIIGAVVGFFAISMISPMYNLSGVI